MNNDDSLKKVISAINTGQKYPALKLVQKSPETAAMISKLVSPLDKTSFDIRRPNADSSLNRSQIQSVSESTKIRITDNENITQIFPDIELAIQILVSSIMSPKDMVKSELIYKAKENILPSELSLKLNTIIRQQLEGYHALKDELPQILRDTLFTTGSYVKAVIPESVVDELINSNRSISNESLSDLFTAGTKVRHLGILGNGGKRLTTMNSALESFLRQDSITAYDPVIKFSDKDKGTVALEHLEVTDNFQLLKLPQVVQKAIATNIKGKVKQTLKASMEAYDAGSKKLSHDQMYNIAYKGQRRETQQFTVVPDGKSAKRKSIGRPLVLRLPSESVIPVYIPGNEKQHIGYFVLVDIDGNPVNRNSVDTSGESLSGLAGLNQNSGTAQAQSMSSMLIAKAKRNLAAQDTSPTVDNITKVYASIVESNLMERLSNGIYGDNVQISNNEEIYRIMLARSLSSKFTRLVYIPSDLTTYFAFAHYPNGIGKSYLDNIKNLTSLRAILLYSKVMAQVKSAISLTHVGMTLDPNDPDPQKTIEMAQHEIVKMRQQYFPLGINSPVDLVNWIQRAGLEFSFEGHPGLPQTKFDFETKTMQRDVPDSELDEMLRKQTYMAFGLSPEVVDQGFNAEFATSVVANNILLSKRVIQLQSVFTPQLSDYCRKLINNDSIIQKEMIAVLEDNFGLLEKTLTDDDKEECKNNRDGYLMGILERFVENFYIDLPQPDITALHSQSEAFGEYSEALEKAIESWISATFMTSDLAGDISSNIDSIKAVVKAHFLRKWMADNGYMPELHDIVTADEDGNATLDIFDMNQNHMDGIIRSATKFIQSLQPMVTAANTDLGNMGVAEGDSGGSNSDDGSSSGDDFGMDDGGLDLDTGVAAPTDDAADIPKGEVADTQTEEPKSEDDKPAE